MATNRSVVALIASASALSLSRAPAVAQPQQSSSRSAAILAAPNCRLEAGAPDSAPISDGKLIAGLGGLLHKKKDEQPAHGSDGKAGAKPSSDQHAANGSAQTQPKKPADDAASHNVKPNNTSASTGSGAGATQQSPAYCPDAALISVLRDLNRALGQPEETEKIDNVNLRAVLDEAKQILSKSLELPDLQADRIDRANGSGMSTEAWAPGEVKLADGSRGSLAVVWAKRVNGLINVTIAGESPDKHVPNGRRMGQFVVVLNARSPVSKGIDIQTQSEVRYWVGKLNQIVIECDCAEPAEDATVSDTTTDIKKKPPMILGAVITDRAREYLVKLQGSQPRLAVARVTEEAAGARPLSARASVQPVRDALLGSPAGSALSDSDQQASATAGGALAGTADSGSAASQRALPGPVPDRSGLRPNSDQLTAAAAKISDGTTFGAVPESKPGETSAARETTAASGTGTSSADGPTTASTGTGTPAASTTASTTTGTAIPTASTGDAATSPAASIGTATTSPAASNGTASNESGMTPSIGTDNPVEVKAASAPEPAPATASATVAGSGGPDPYAGLAPATESGAMLDADTPPMPEVAPPGPKPRLASAAPTSPGWNDLVPSGAPVSETIRQPSASAHVVIPDRAVAGQLMSASVLNAQGACEPCVELTFNSSVVQTDVKGAAVYMVPEDSNPGRSLSIMLAARPDGPIAAVDVLQPLSVPSEQEPPKVDRVLPSAFQNQSTIVIDGHNFDGFGAHNHVSIDARTEARVIAASPVQLKVQLPAGMASGVHSLTVSIGDMHSNAVSFNFFAPQSRPGQAPARFVSQPRRIR